MLIQKEINSVIGKQGLMTEVYDVINAEIFYNEIYAKYHNGKDAYPLWDNLLSFSSAYNKDRWRFIGDFVGDQSCVLFLEKTDGQFIIELSSGFALNVLLENTFVFVFYISNRNMDFLVCFNDHDCLLGSGNAHKWVDCIV